MVPDLLSITTALPLLSHPDILFDMSSEQFPLTPEGARAATELHTALEKKHHEFSTAMTSGDFEKAEVLKAELETGIADLSERLISPLEREILTPKAEQGFKKFLIVPARLSIKSRAKAYRQVIKEHKASGALKGADGTDLEIGPTEPVYLWDAYKDETKIVYHLTQFTKTGHNGLTKDQLVASRLLLD